MFYIKKALKNFKLPNIQYDIAQDCLFAGEKRNSNHRYINLVSKLKKYSNFSDRKQAQSNKDLDHYIADDNANITVLDSDIANSNILQEQEQKPSEKIIYKIIYVKDHSVESDIMNFYDVKDDKNQDKLTNNIGNDQVQQNNHLKNELDKLYKSSNIQPQDEVDARFASWLVIELLYGKKYRKVEDFNNKSEKEENEDNDKQEQSNKKEEYTKVMKFHNNSDWFDIKRQDSSIEYSNHEIYYEVILGSINFDNVISKLKKVFEFKEEESSQNISKDEKEKIVIASILMDRNFNLVADGGINISSFAWALSFVLKKDFAPLASWIKVEQIIQKGLRRFINSLCENEDGTITQINLGIIYKLYELLTDLFDLDKDILLKPSFLIRRLHSKSKASKYPDCLLLNSFYIDDLLTAKEIYRKSEELSKKNIFSSNINSIKQTNIALRKYLGKEQPLETYDLLLEKNRDLVEEALSPCNIPNGKWHIDSCNLYLMQQAAVNLSRKELKDKGGIFAVNGPPGTGKTTLLREIVASIVTDRASVMCSFEDPENAFIDSEKKVNVYADTFSTIHKLHDSLKGYEILVASSNNNAVENVSKELPNAKGKYDSNLEYFKTIIDAIFNHKDKKCKDKDKDEKKLNNWGLIASVLGKAENKQKFADIFWFKDDYSIRSYLQYIKSRGQNNSIKQEDGTLGRVKKILKKENPPDSIDQAKSNWYKVKNEFLSHKKEVDDYISKIEEIRQVYLKIRKANKLLDRLRDDITNDGNELAKLIVTERDFCDLWNNVKDDFDSNIDKLMRDNDYKPYWFKFIFKIYAPDFIPDRLLSERCLIWNNLKKLYIEYCVQKDSLVDLENDLKNKRKSYNVELLDDDFFAKTYEEMHITTPCFSEELNLMREKLFGLAMNVHNAFIDVCASKLLENLSIMINILKNNVVLGEESKKYLSDLWSTLFLIVPVASTTFASVNRMLNDLDPESIGWLLIDEAGQATPQSAIGAIMRSKRVLVVGDPKQIPPIIDLPESIVKHICDFFNVDHNQWSAPNASVQILADRASLYQSKFNKFSKEANVGLPLIVHRRCEDPMFSISNLISYNNCMVSQVVDAKSCEVRDVLGKSGWFDTTNMNNINPRLKKNDNPEYAKWSEQEGQLVINIFKKLAEHRIKRPEIFIVSPFRIVASEITRMFKDNKYLLNKLDLSNKYSEKNIGTLHRFQGKEARNVILLLGAPLSSQKKSRNWASNPANLLNVAVSRAKTNFYVIGSRSQWQEHGCFKHLTDDIMPNKRL